MFNNDIYKNMRGRYDSVTYYLSSFLTETVKDVNVADSEGFTKLHIAVKNADFKEVIRLVSSGAEINKFTLNDSPCTSLHISVILGNLDITDYLLDNSANVNLKDSKNYTPLQIAVYLENLEIVKSLIDNDADVNVRDSEGTPLLHYAINKKNLKLIKLLMTSWLDGTAIDQKGRTALQLSVEIGAVEILSELIECKSTNFINTKTNKCDYPLHLAVASNNLVIVKLLVDRGADTNLLDNISRVTPLYIAVSNNLIEITEFLVFKGKSNVNFLKIGDETLLYKAIKNGYEIIFKILIEAGAISDIEVNNNLLNIAASTGQFESVKVLIKAGANLSLTNANKKDNPLYSAVIVSKDTKIVKVLIENGINIPINFLKIAGKKYSSSKEYDQENQDNILQILKVGLLADKVWSGEDIKEKIIIKEEFYGILSSRLKIYFSKNCMSCNVPKKVLDSKSYVKHIQIGLINFIKNTITELDNISLQLKIYNNENEESSSCNNAFKTEPIGELTHISE